VFLSDKTCTVDHMMRACQTKLSAVFSAVHKFTGSEYLKSDQIFLIVKKVYSLIWMHRNTMDLGKVIMNESAEMEIPPLTHVFLWGSVAQFCCYRPLALLAGSAAQFDRTACV